MKEHIAEAKFNFIIQKGKTSPRAVWVEFKVAYTV